MINFLFTICWFQIKISLANSQSHPPASTWLKSAESEWQPHRVFTEEGEKKVGEQQSWLAKGRGLFFSPQDDQSLFWFHSSRQSHEWKVMWLCNCPLKLCSVRRVETQSITNAKESLGGALEFGAVGCIFWPFHLWLEYEWDSPLCILVVPALRPKVIMCSFHYLLQSLVPGADPPPIPHGEAVRALGSKAAAGQTESQPQSQSA
jgi:hypothetical protein